MMDKYGEYILMALGFAISLVWGFSFGVQHEQRRQQEVSAQGELVQPTFRTGNILQFAPPPDATRVLTLPESLIGKYVLPDRGWEMTEADLDTQLSDGHTVRDVILFCWGSSFPESDTPGRNPPP